MTTTTTKIKPADLTALRLEIEEFNTAYADCLDDGDVTLWPGFFTEDAIYKILPRENWEQGLPVAAMFVEGRGGLIDRVVGVTKTVVYRRRFLRLYITNTRIRSADGESIKAEANYQVLETLPDEFTKILNAGRYFDTFVREAGALKLKERLCIYDSEMVPATLVYPI